MPKPKVVYRVTFLVTDRGEEPVSRIEVRDAIKDMVWESETAVVSKLQVVDEV